MENRKDTVSNFPKIEFQISNNEKDVPWRDELQEYINKFQPEWRKVEYRVMGTFEEITGGEWKNRESGDEILVTFSGIEIPRSNPLTLRHRDYSDWARKRDLKGQLLDPQIQAGVLIHELGHRFATKDDITYVKGKCEGMVNIANLQNDFRVLKGATDIAIKGAWTHVHTELLWKAVIEEVFSNEVVKKMEERAREVAPMYVEAYRIIDLLSDEEKRKIVDPRLR